MTDDSFFKRLKPNARKLLDYGFCQNENGFEYCTSIMDGQFFLHVRISNDGTVDTKTVDSGSGDEYSLHRLPDAAGGFVGCVKAEYSSVLSDVAEFCFDTDVFKSADAKRIIAYVENAYGDEPEYLWQKFPDNAVWRRKDNNKWYGAILTVSRKKLGLESDGNVEIVDLRIRPESLTETLDYKKYLPGYHMNKKSWYTICLDGSVDVEEICRRIDESYALAKK